MLRRIYVLLNLSFLAASAAVAQTSGTIIGSVRDASGATVAGATFTINNLDRGTSQTQSAIKTAIIRFRSFRQTMGDEKNTVGNF